jgi:hypothetical protein
MKVDTGFIETGNARLYYEMAGRGQPICPTWIILPNFKAPCANFSMTSSLNLEDDLEPSGHPRESAQAAPDRVSGKVRMRFRHYLLGSAVAVIVLTAGCAARRGSSQGESPMRTATDVPEHFMVATVTGVAEPGGGEDCHNPIVDPRDGTRLKLIRSAEGRGDYEPHPIRYGLQKGELLQVECATGRAVGIVKR